jgi:hypothetical protein
MPDNYWPPTSGTTTTTDPIKHETSHRPNTDQQPATIHDLQTHKVQHTRILGGLINEYRYTA